MMKCVEPGMMMMKRYFVLCRVAMLCVVLSVLWWGCSGAPALAAGAGGRGAGRRGHAAGAYPARPCRRPRVGAAPPRPLACRGAPLSAAACGGAPRHAAGVGTAQKSLRLNTTTYRGVGGRRSGYVLTKVGK